MFGLGRSTLSYKSILNLQMRVKTLPSFCMNKKKSLTLQQKPVGFVMKVEHNSDGRLYRQGVAIGDLERL